MNIEPSVAVYEWRTKQEVIFSSCASNSTIRDCKFLGSDNKFGICGDNFILFWERSEKRYKFSRHRGVFGTKVRKQLLNCMVHFKNNWQLFLTCAI